jgi:hypothetical protein
MYIAYVDVVQWIEVRGCITSSGIGRSIERTDWQWSVMDGIECVIVKIVIVIRRSIR